MLVQVKHRVYVFNRFLLQKIKGYVRIKNGQKQATNQQNKILIHPKIYYCSTATQVIRGQGATIPAPTLQFTLNTTVDLGVANLVPHYTRELQVLHPGLPIRVKLPIPIIQLKLR